MPASTNISLSINDEIAKKLSDEKFAEIVLREKNARISAIIKCAINKGEDQSTKEQVLEKAIEGLGSFNAELFNKDASNMYKELKALKRGFLDMSDSARKTVSRMDKCLDEIKSLGVLQGVDVAISFSNLITTSGGIVYLSNRLDKISKELGEASRKIDALHIKMDQSLSIQRNTIIGEYKSISKHYYTMAMRIASKDTIDPLEINDLIITISIFIDNIFRMFNDNALDHELALSMMYSLVPPYTSLIREYIIRYFCAKETIPSNYVDHLETLNIFLDDEFCNKVRECYFIELGISNRASINAVNAEIMEITNSVVKVRDIKDLLLILETRENYQKLNESLDKEARVYAEEYCGVLLAK